MIASTQISVVDYADALAGGDRRHRFVTALGEGLERLGFVAVVGHGVPDALLADAFVRAAEVFALPDAVKRRCEAPEIARQRGYTPLMLERAKDQAVGDLKEFWHIGRDVDAGEEARGGLPANRLPPEVPGFAETARALFARQEALALELLRAIAEYLGEPTERFAALAEGGNSVLRVIHYPDLPGAAAAGGVRAAAHEDINLITLLPTATRPGLQILTREGEWVDVVAPPGAMICDTGDMMALLTDGRMPATTHRVVNPPGGVDGGRMSIPFFLHPHPDALLAPPMGARPPIRAHDFLLERLVANNVAAG